VPMAQERINAPDFETLVLYMLLSHILQLTGPNRHSGNTDTCKTTYSCNTAFYRTATSTVHDFTRVVALLKKYHIDAYNAIMVQYDSTV